MEIKDLKKYNWLLMEKLEKCPLWLAWSPLSAFAYLLEKEIGVGIQHAFFITQKGNFYMYFVESEFRKGGEVVLGKTLEDYRFLKKILDDIEDLSKKLIDYGEKLQKLTPSKMTDKELAEDFKKFYQIHEPLWVKGQAVNYLEHESNFLSSAVREMLKKEGVMVNEVEQVFAIMVNPEVYSYAQKEEQDLINIAVSDKMDEKNLYEHWKKYCWTGYDWMGPVWSREYFEERLDLLRKDNSIKNHIKSESDYSKEIIRNKKVLIKKYGFSQQLLNLIKLVERIIYLKGFRVDASWFGYYSLEPIFREIAKRYGLSLRQLQYATPEEIMNLRFDPDCLNQRWQSSAIEAENGKVREIDGKKAKDYLIEIERLTFSDQSGIDQLTGDCGCPGYAKGYVKVINAPSDMNKMREGDIMVSHMTNPALVPAMRKASAIIADVGGVTCHAAIVSRELKLPCIIGTKIATKALHDGDLVEVDANMGIVRILEK
ncbi:MAG: PEP-utilizing enzyme [Patescibacteria group bacterium]|nr:PEP-utilizing enzyme [Patescibacteria group bacterium]